MSRIWTAEQVALLGTDTDKAIADRLGCKTRDVVLARKARAVPAHRQDLVRKGVWVIAENVSRLGQAPDSALASELGLSVKAVQSARKARGIPPFVERSGWGGFEGVLGKIPDSTIAKIRGVSKAAVASARKARGIKSFRAARIAGERT